jgi:hypothetical protein
MGRRKRQLALHRFASGPGGDRPETSDRRMIRGASKGAWRRSGAFMQALQAHSARQAVDIPHATANRAYFI